MATMNVSLPDEMKSYVEDNVKSGKYANASDYVRDLIRKDNERNAAFENIQALITEGVESGVSESTAEEIWERVLARHNNG